MKTSNPVLTRLGQAAERERTAGYGPGYGQPYPTASGYAAAPPAVQPMTIDDVVVKTVILLGITGLSAIAAWNLIPDALLGAAWIGAAVVGLVLGLIISFSRMANPALVIAYAVVEGAFVGLVSKYFEVIAGFEGIVLQAVIATFGVFFVMAVLYRARVIRATPRFTRGFGIIFSLVCIVVAALSFILDFDQIEQGVRMGLPQRYSWTAAFGVLVGLIWLYLEVLRLLSYLRGDD